MTKSTNNYSLQNNHYLSKMTNFINGFEQIKLLNIQSWTQEKIQEISLEFEESRKNISILKRLSFNYWNFTKFWLSTILYGCWYLFCKK